jgi:uncharacterized protein (TIGR02597 family)
MMKNPTKFIALLSGAALLASSSVFAASVATDPVGYVTLTVNGTGGAGSSAISVLGAPLENAADASAALTAVAGTTLTSGTSAWTPGAFASTHYVQITSGVNAGISATVTGNTDTTLTTAEDISSLLAGDESFMVRAYTTLADVFGAANESGIGSGANAAVADEILVYNGAGFDIYYYQEGAAFGGDGWRTSVNAFTNQAGAPLPSGLALVVKRKQDADVSVVVTGNVLTTDSFVPVEGGVNWLSGANPIDYTLASYFGADGGDLQSGANAAAADEILVPKDGGGFDIYYYQEGAAFGGDGYRSSINAFTNASATVLASVGEGFVLKRKGAAYNQLDVSPLN